LDIYNSFGLELLSDTISYKYEDVITILRLEISKDLNLRKVVKSFLKPFVYGQQKSGFADKLRQDYNLSQHHAYIIFNLFYNALDLIYPHLAIAVTLLNTYNYEYWNTMNDLSLIIQIKYMETTIKSSNILTSFINDKNF
jgi:hypothetical protein